MVGIICRSLFIVAVAGASAVFLPTGLSHAAECGYGTVYDPGSDTCVVAPAPPPPPPPPPAWNGDITPYFSVGVCAPIRFVSVCGSF